MYDEVTEEEYKKIVADRRKTSNFVVDDMEGMGYHDDGEEHLFDATMDDDGEERIVDGADLDGKKRKGDDA